MKMDPSFGGFSGSGNRIRLNNQSVSILSNPNPNLVVGPRFENANSFVDHNFRGFCYPPPDPIQSNVEEDSQEDCEFSDVVLRYISQMLMEEDMVDKTCMLQDSLDLQAAEKSLYEVIGRKYPPSPEQNSTYHISQNGENPYDNLSGSLSNCVSSSITSSGCLVDNIWAQDMGEYNSFQLQNFPVYSTSQSSSDSPNGIANTLDGLVDSPNSTLHVPDWGSESQSVWQFKKGVEEASKFLPSGNDLFANLEPPRGKKSAACDTMVQVERRGEGRKNIHREGVDFEKRKKYRLRLCVDTTLCVHG